MTISQQLRDLRSTNAKLKKLGGSRLKRTVLTIDEISNIITLYKNDKSSNVLKGLFSRNIVSKSGFKWDISRHLFEYQQVLLIKELLLLDDINCNICNYCKCETEFNLKTKKYNKFCVECYKSRPWIHKMKSIEDRLVQYNKTSNSLKLFAKTKIGEELYKNLGKHNSVKMKEFNKTDKGKDNIRKNANRNSKLMREKIALGNYTPPITNSFTHWDAKILLNSGEIKKFRSSWEACFYFCNQHLLFEKLRIPYFDCQKQVERTYIADFFDNVNNILYELKPKSQWLQSNAKLQQIISYCLKNNIKFIWLNEDNILDYIDEFLFIGENVLQLKKLKKGIKNGSYFVTDKVN